jgi:hypothetical protein
VEREPVGRERAAPLGVKAIARLGAAAALAGTALLLSAGAQGQPLFRNGQTAALVVGQPDFTTFRREPTRNSVGAPAGLAVHGDVLAIADAANSRVLIWRPVPSRSGERASVVLGQTGFEAGSEGAGRSGMKTPFAVAYDGKRFFVADTGNHRVLVWNSLPTRNYQPADIVLGQADFNQTGSNQGGSAGNATLNEPYGVHSDGRRLLVADTGNHRVLVWLDLEQLSTDRPADIVLGQTGPTGRTARNAFNTPTRVVSDGERVVVSDEGNHRLLVWTRPLTASRQDADFVLGQADFTSRAANRGGRPGANTLCSPQAGLGPNGIIVVGDFCNARVLFWERPITGNGQPADGVLGQSGFLTNELPGQTAAGPGATAFLPRPASAAMTETGLWVADLAANRVLFYQRVR